MTSKHSEAVSHRCRETADGKQESLFTNATRQQTADKKVYSPTLQDSRRQTRKSINQRYKTADGRQESLFTNATRQQTTNKKVYSPTLQDSRRQTRKSIHQRYKTADGKQECNLYLSLFSVTSKHSEAVSHRGRETAMVYSNGIQPVMVSESEKNEACHGVKPAWNLACCGIKPAVV